MQQRRGIHKGVYVVPSLITTVALFLGFYSIIYCLQSLRDGQVLFEPAVFAIIMAGVFDNLDGRIARLMKVESDFGVQYDSIADMVSFGIAPAILVYSFALIDLKRLGWFGAFVYLACAGIRLARFNVITKDQPSKKYFKGMSSPVAAGGLCVTMLVLSEGLSGKTFSYVCLAVTFFFRNAYGL